MDYNMNYKECRAYLKTLNEKYGISPGLDTIKKLLSLCKNPEDNVKIIHVAGTNGKGSVSTFISYILSAGGYKIGRYISPAVNGYREKIQYIENDEVTYISETDVSRYISLLRKKSEEVYFETKKHPTEFEIETAMAFMAFADWKCDYVVLECGMGGRDDATNAVENKEICVFTTIAMDHTEYLGDTLSQIAENKAGILRKGVRAVSSRQVSEVADVFIKYADRYKASLSFISEYDILESKAEGTVLRYRKKKWNIPLPGIYQAENAVTAIEAVKALDGGKLDINDDIIRKGLNNAKWPKRFEIVKENPYIIIDGAHNPCGIKRLVESINAIFPKSRFYRIGIMGVFADKDVAGMVSGISGVFNEIHTVTAPGMRGLPAEKLSGIIKDITGEKAICHEGMEAKELCSDIINGIYKETEDMVIIIFGSLSLTAEN